MAALKEKSCVKGYVCLLSYMMISALTHGTPIPGNSVIGISAGNSSDPSVTATNISKSDSFPDLPEGWEKLCTKSEQFVTWNFTTLSPKDVKDMVQISCYLQHNQRLLFTDFRAWLNSSNAGVKFALKVECDASTEGAFYVPWPMKVRDFVYLKITGCQVHDYYSEYLDNAVTRIPDQLRVYEIKNSVIHVDLLQVYEIGNNLDKTSIDVECGPLTMEKFAFSNIKYELNFMDYFAAMEPANMTLDGDYEADYDDYAQNEEELSEEVLSNFLKMKHKCPYDHLRHQDESYFTKMSGYHLYSLQTKANYPELMVYNLSHVGFDVLPIELRRWRFHNMRKLSYLDLSHNNIYEIEFYDDGAEDHGIGVINLQYNNINQLRYSDLRSLQRLKTATVDIRNNLLNCSCGMLHDFYEFLKTPDLGRYEYLRDLKCGWPESLRGRKVSELSEVQVQCTEGLHALAGALSCVVLFLIILVVVLWKYRREVVILVYTRLHIVLPCQTVENTGHKDFDAFISYSSKDDEWVLKTLVQRLENPESGSTGFRLCVHHRDFEIGAAIADNVVRSVESSRHTIMVLSRNYVHSEWCIYEFRTAMHQSLIERRKHLILILLEDVVRSELDSDLRKCLETFTYIHAGETLFWDKLRYSLTVRNKNKTKSLSKSSSQSVESECEKENLKSPSNNNIV